MFSKSKLDFVVDALILIAFLAATVSGLVLLTMPHGGYQGGRNPNFGQTVLLLSRDAWNDIHVWGSLAVIVGVVVHLALHWRWIVFMLRRFIATGTRSALAGGAQPSSVIVPDN
jgi:Na+/H+-translocating membrane pyrophosphatase